MLALFPLSLSERPISLHPLTAAYQLPQVVYFSSGDRSYLPTSLDDIIPTTQLSAAWLYRRSSRGDQGGLAIVAGDVRSLRMVYSFRFRYERYNGSILLLYVAPSRHA